MRTYESTEIQIRLGWKYGDSSLSLRLIQPSLPKIQRRSYIGLIGCRSLHLDCTSFGPQLSTSSSPAISKTLATSTFRGALPRTNWTDLNCQLDRARCRETSEAASRSTCTYFRGALCPTNLRSETQSMLPQAGSSPHFIEGSKLQCGWDVTWTARQTERNPYTLLIFTNS